MSNAEIADAIDPRTKRNFRAVWAMAKRWDRDLARLNGMFGEYDGEHFDAGAEMQRNLGTAVVYADIFLTSCAGKFQAPPEEIK